MDTLEMMRIFVRVAEGRSFTSAAQRLDITVGSTSRSISYLETRLRTRLFNRSTRSIALTEAGHRYFQRCQKILGHIEQAEAEAADAQARPAGRLRVHAMPGFGQAYLVPAIMGYQQRYPSVSVELILSQNVPDIIDEGYDVAIQMTTGQLSDSGLISHQLGTLHSVLCASPAYLDKYGKPNSVDELACHACLQLVTSLFPRNRWDLEGPHGRETFVLPPAAFGVNVPDALSTALRNGNGIGTLPTPSAIPHLKSGSLVRLLPGHQLQELTAYVLYASRQFLDAKIATFVTFLREVVPQALAADQALLSQLSLS